MSVPELNECLSISKTFIANLESLLPLTPSGYLSARDCSTDGLASANLEKSLDHLNKLEDKAFQFK